MAVPVTEADDLLWYINQERVGAVSEVRRTHVKALTYGPKIAAVLGGDCGQTIRPISPEGTRVFPGDDMLFHGWEDRPYRSRWSKWRCLVTVTEVEELVVHDDPCAFTIHRHGPEASFTGKWTGPLADHLAQRDHIVPATGTALRKVLESFYGDLAGMRFSIIRWDPREAVVQLYPDDDQEGSP